MLCFPHSYYSHMEVPPERVFEVIQEARSERAFAKILT